MPEQEIEFPEYDDKMELFFTWGSVKVKESDKWDYVVTSYAKDGELVYQEQTLSEENEKKLNESEDDNKEAFDPVNQTWPTENPNPDHGCGCQMGKGEEQTYENQGPTLYHQATPQFTPRESSIGIGKQNPDNTDRNIVPRASQAFSSKNNDFQLGINLLKENKFTFEECSMEWKEAELPREDGFEMPSVVVGKVQYFPEEKSMLIELNGRVYPYYNIEYRQFDAFKGATSKGSAYNLMFKGQTQYFSPRNENAINQEALNKAILYRESMMIDNPDDFHWIDEIAIKEMIQEGKKGIGKYILLKAAEGTITDHRVEGEEHKRIITPEILKKLTYTAIKKGSDINHLFKKRDLYSGTVVDAEFNDRTGFSEFMYFESDKEILQGIEDGFITAVSINGGAARSYKIIDGKGIEMDKPGIECADGECYRLGEGIILGEKDNVAFTWVVTKPGWRYNGRMIPNTTPGIMSTRILVL